MSTRVVQISDCHLFSDPAEELRGVQPHQAVLAAGERVSGATIHMADKVYDHGPIVSQCQVQVTEDDTVDTLTERVQRRERELWVETLQKIARQEIDLEGIGGPTVPRVSHRTKSP